MRFKNNLRHPVGLMNSSIEVGNGKVLSHILHYFGTNKKGTFCPMSKKFGSFFYFVNDSEQIELGSKVKVSIFTGSYWKNRKERDDFVKRIQEMNTQ